MRPLASADDVRQRFISLSKNSGADHSTPPMQLQFVELTPSIAAELEAAATDHEVVSNYDLRGGVQTGQRLFAPGDDAGAYLRRNQRMSRAALLSDDQSSLVGVFTLQAGELSYFVLRNHWGQGYGQQIVHAACKAAFDELGLNALDAVVISTNAPSQKIIESRGFHINGRARMTAARRGQVEVIRYRLLANQAP